MNNVKKLSIVIIFVLMFNNIVFSLDVTPYNHLYKIMTSEEKAKLSDNTIYFNEIEDMISLYNPVVQNNWNAYDANKTSTDVYNDYMDAYDSLDALASSTDNDVQAAMYRAQADAMRINADKNVVDSNVNFLNYYMVEKNLALATKTLFINYYKYGIEEGKANANLKEANRKYNTAKNNYDLGNLTRVEFLLASKNVDDARADVLSASSKRENAKRNLIINCGKSVSEEVIIMQPNIVSSDEIKKINISIDTIKAINNNIQYEIYKRQFENATTEEMRNQNQINMSAAENYIRADVEKKYSDLKDQLSIYDTEFVNYQYVKDEFKTAENSFNMGTISEKEFETARYNKNIADFNLQIANFDLAIAYENYLATINGLASAGN